MGKVTVLAGVSGTGKTYRRTHDPQLERLPYVDIADVYKQMPWADWQQATVAVATKASRLLRSHDHVVVEGYFLPRSESRALLLRELNGHDVKIIHLTASLLECEKRIRSQYMSGGCTEFEMLKRIELLYKCHPDVA